MGRPSLSFLFPHDDGVPDAVLLRRFTECHDEVAFELLVRRYADVVWTVCRHTAGDHHAAEDAFQAAFLALAKRATSVRDNLAGWLHRVGYHAALKARQVRRNQALNSDPAAPPVDTPGFDVTEVIHAELTKLPDRYRLPLVLCDLEGLTHTEAAKQLGWPVGSVSGRLVRGRERLKAKLLRHGIVPAVVVLSVIPLHASAPIIRLTTTAALDGKLTPSVAALLTGVLSTMQFAKMKFLAAVTCGVFALGSVTTVIGLSAAYRPDDAAKPTGQAAAKPAEKPAAKPAEKPERIADAKARALSTNNLKQIMLAIHNYHDATGQLPTDIVDKNGKPLLSWRVAILPYIEQAALYNQFKLDEPWDSENNKKYSQIIVKLYHDGMAPAEGGYPKTHMQRPTGQGTAHESGQKLKLTDIRDGTSNTIFVVETKESVEWAKPADMPFDLTKPTELHGPYANVLHCAIGDGSVRTIAGGLSADAAKKLISRAGGENVDFKTFEGLGWKGGQPADPAEAAKLIKEIEEATTLLMKAHDDTLRIQLEINKLNAERLKKQAGNVGLATQLLELQDQIRQAKLQQNMLKTMLDQMTQPENKPKPTPVEVPPKKE